MRILWGLLALGMTIVGPAHAQTKKPVEALDLYRLAQAVDPQMSPDGRQIAVLRQTRDIQTDRVNTELWLVPVPGPSSTGLMRRLVVGADRAPNSPRWSPDGNSIAFIGKEGTKTQLFVVNVSDDVIAKSITTLKFPPLSFAWSPDSLKIAFVNLVEDKPAPIYELPAKPEGAIWAPTPRIIRTFPYRTDADGWSTQGDTQVFVVGANSGDVIQVTNGRGNWGARDAAPAWTADGQSLVMSADTHPDANRRANQGDLYMWPARVGGTSRQLTSDNGFETSPAISPDGTKLAYVGWRVRATSFQRTDIFLGNLSPTAPLANVRNLTADLDRNASQITWQYQSQGLAYLYQDQGVNRVAYTALSNGGRAIIANNVGNTRLLLPSSGGGSYSIGRAVSSVAAITTDYDKPGILSVHTGTRTQTVWDMNAAWRVGKDIGRLEEIWTPSSADGRRVHGWILYPPNFDPTKKYPLALDIHGGPHIDYGPLFSITHHLYAAAGYVTLFTNPRGSIGYGEEFANLINLCYPCQDHDDLMSSVDAVVARGFIDTNRLYIGGGSGGGVLSSWAIGKTNRFAAASVKRPVINWTSEALTSDIGAVVGQYWFAKMPWEEPEKYWARSPLSLVGNVRTPTLIITGENDFRTPMSESEQYFQALQLQGVESALIRLPEAGHGFGRPSQWLAPIMGTIGWYDTHTKPVSLPANP